jgi:superfamily II DNA or RNA helicase
MNLRPYQIELKDEIRSNFAAGNRAVVLCSPTGSGKTVTFADIAADTVKKGMSVIVVVDRKELIEQSVHKLKEYGLNPEIITGGVKWINYKKNCFVATVQTLKKRSFPSANLVIIDEAHKQIFDEVAIEYQKKGAFVIGATATPIRKGKTMTQLGDIYSAMVETVNITDLISDGFLCPARTIGVQVDVDDVKMKSGDYDSNQLFEAYDKPFLYDGLIDKYIEFSRMKKTIIFNINVEHSKKTKNAFLAAGFDCRHIDGATPKNERESNLRWFKHTPGAILCNVDILTTGYDEPSIETVVINRRTKSVPLWLQMCGRGSRLFPGKKEFTIIDMGGNTTELGYWERERSFSLWHKVSNKAGIAPQKQCPDGLIEINDEGGFDVVSRDDMDFKQLKKYGCGDFVHASAPFCPKCGFVFPKIEMKLIDSTFSEISEVTIPEHLKKPIKEMSFRELVDFQELKGFKKHWILHNIEQSRENLTKFASFMGYDSKWVYYAENNLI